VLRDLQPTEKLLFLSKLAQQLAEQLYGEGCNCQLPVETSRPLSVAMFFNCQLPAKNTHTHIYIIIYVYIYVHIHTYYCEDYVVKQLAPAAYIITASLLNSVPLLLLDGRFVQARLRGYEGASRGRDV
jgi:hypothetical protein